MSHTKPKYGFCPCCSRQVALTFHHFIPKKMHRRQYFRKHFSRDKLNNGMSVCRACHDGIHSHYDEMTLAKHYYNAQRLLVDDTLRQHYHWISKQKVRHRF
ncbi:HNH endonuclease [Aestuariibacter salexigens]|uniref:HNH endonuclease n=1 Tax=Aestuariibacter salexigens TaxID=226010 RepID=UPI000A02B3ED|nr:HNH endonuclease [Aestuariibacter salexigens]